MTGYLFRALGARWTLRLYGVTSVCLIPIFFVLDWRWPLIRSKAEEAETQTGQDVKLMSHLSPEVPENNHLLMTQLPSRCDRDLPKGDNCMVMQTYATIDELQSDDEDESRSDRQEVTGRK